MILSALPPGAEEYDYSYSMEIYTEPFYMSLAWGLPLSVILLSYICCGLPYWVWRYDRKAKSKHLKSTKESKAATEESKAATEESKAATEEGKAAAKL